MSGLRPEPLGSGGRAAGTQTESQAVRGAEPHTHPSGVAWAVGPSLPACWAASSCATRLSICPIICCTLLVSLLLALDSSTSISLPVFESSFLISCKS